MIIEIQKSGLCNRLMILLYFINKYQDEGLKVVWTPNYACNGNFLDYFEPINNISFVETKNELQNVFNATLKYMINSQQDDLGKSCIFMQLNQLKLIPEIQSKLDYYLNSLTKPFIAIHIRRTDYGRILQKLKDAPTEDDFHEFISQYPNHDIYIATDCKKMQLKFINKYVDRILFYKKIEACEGTTYLRQTNLEHSIMDIYICCHAEYFMGTKDSTFSRFIKQLKNKI